MIPLKPQDHTPGETRIKMRTDGSDQFLEKDERQMWECFLQGEDQGLIYLYRKYVEDLFRYGQQFSRRYEFVQDSIQELFYELIDKRKKLSSAKSVKAYLFSSLKRKMLRDIRKEEKVQLESHGFLFSFAEMPVSISQDLKEQDMAMIFEKINELPSSQREVIFLYFYQGLGYAEIADIMNVKVATARTLTYRALENLEKELGPHLSSFYGLFICFLPH